MKKLSPEQADAKRRRVWISIVKKEIPKVSMLGWQWRKDKNLRLMGTLSGKAGFHFSKHLKPEIL